MRSHGLFLAKFILAVFGLLWTASCTLIANWGNPSGPVVTRVFQKGTFEYEIDTVGGAKDVIFVFSASADRSLAATPTVTALSVNGQYLPLPAAPTFPAAPVEDATTAGRIAGLSRWVLEHLRLTAVPHSRLQASHTAIGQYLSAVNDTASFADITLSGNPIVDATCRYVFTESTATAADGVPRKVSIWVSDDQWHESAAGRITQQMVEELGSRFLKSGADNDIYDWLTAILGPEWGAPAYSNLIEHSGEITIFLTDIENDASENGGIVGYFSSLNSIKNETLVGTMAEGLSNERVMFVMDAPMYANAGGGTWSPDGYWQDIVFSTLAHEFQHMIHFYQKQLRFNVASTDAWIDELCAQLAEDLLADKMGVSGPRGIAPAIGHAGSGGNTNGRLPDYNRYTHLPLESTDSAWQQANAVYYYSVVYAFGAWAARNYGGAQFLRDIVRSRYTDRQAIEYAAAQAGANPSDLDSLLARWAVAVMASDRTDMPPGYRLNTGDWISSTVAGKEYRLGSINFFNYSYAEGRSGPLFVEAGQQISSQSASTNVFYAAARGLVGKKSFTITVPDGIEMYVVLK